MAKQKRTVSGARSDAGTSSKSIPAAPRRSPQLGDHGSATDAPPDHAEDANMESYTPYNEGPPTSAHSPRAGVDGSPISARYTHYTHFVYANVTDLM